MKANSDKAHVQSATDQEEIVRSRSISVIFLIDSVVLFLM